ncbi:unnamed protein product [Polarella glacialis]|uniref:Uncharacterized protein n=1 Tax=Polarella glacialis TaxID=89957 RepID=A0A813KQV3_POLGL|nr:unnamed protein product [Polarella glacialis]
MDGLVVNWIMPVSSAVFSDEGAAEETPPSRFMGLVQRLVEVHEGASGPGVTASATQDKTGSESESFPELIQALVQEHQRELSAARRGSKDATGRDQDSNDGEGGSGSLQNRRVLADLNISTDSSLTQRISQSSSTVRRIPKNASAWDVDKQTTPLWHLARPDREHKGGSLHVELENKAAQFRLANDSIREKGEDIKQKIKENEVEMLSMIEQLKPLIMVSSDESDAIREELVGRVKSIEEANFALAALRREEFLNLEAIRGLKIRVWRLILDDRADCLLADVEGAMRSGKIWQESWI